MTTIINNTSPSRSWADEVEDGTSLTTDEIVAADSLLLMSTDVNNYIPDTKSMHPSIPLDNDKYNYFGRNISAHERRQKLEPWVKVIKKYKN
tara:strand:- start:220 stop:495 length:276 start_codon:yes stop_codon:yes gene_type:complete